MTPRFEHLRNTMGLDDISKWPQPARVIFSNGMQDPWHAGGVLQNVTETMIAIQIPNGAHHQDLNGGHVHAFPLRHFLFSYHFPVYMRCPRLCPIMTVGS